MEHGFFSTVVSTHVILVREWPYFSRSTGGLLIRVIRLQYQIMMMRMLGVRNVFMANQTLVKPPFWWMPFRERGERTTPMPAMSTVRLLFNANIM